MKVQQAPEYIVVHCLQANEERHGAHAGDEADKRAAKHHPPHPRRRPEHGQTLKSLADDRLQFPEAGEECGVSGSCMKEGSWTRFAHSECNGGFSCISSGLPDGTRSEKPLQPKVDHQSRSDS